MNFTDIFTKYKEVHDHYIDHHKADDNLYDMLESAAIYYKHSSTNRCCVLGCPLTIDTLDEFRRHFNILHKDQYIDYPIHLATARKEFLTP